MNINRYNYEEYFLLYADNELSAAEMNMVEVFLSTNPDLQEEMLMLQQAVIRPEQIKFDKKEDLLKPEPVDEGIQQQLLLLLDNELPENQKGYIQSLSQYDEQVRNEWGLLQQTKLSTADIIVFDDKASLYKKETGRVVAFRWWRVAVAAMLIGFGLWGTVSYFKQNNTSLTAIETAGDNKATNPVKKPVEEITPAQNIPGNTTRENEVATTQIKQNNSNSAFSAKTLVPEKKITPKVVPQKENDDIVQQNEHNNSPVPVLDNVNNYPGNKSVAANVQPQQKDNNNAAGKVDPLENKTTATNTYAVNTLLTNNSDSKKSFASFDEEEENDKQKKSRLGGFFKKVKRVVERKTKINTGDDNNIKIANMSFAIQ